MPKEVNLMVIIRRTGGYVNVPITKKTKIKQIVERVCLSEGIPVDRYQLVVNDNRVLNESKTVETEKIFRLKPVDRVVLTLKASYLYIELQALSMIQEQRIVALAAKAKGETHATVAEPVHTLAEVIKSAGNPNKHELNPTRTDLKPVHTKPTTHSTVESSTSSNLTDKETFVPINGTLIDKCPSASSVTDPIPREVEDKEEDEEDDVEEEEASIIATEKLPISSTSESIVENHSDTVKKPETMMKQSVIIDLEGIAHGISQFPKGLVQDYVHASLTEFNVMLIGAPGTGKRSLISAICGVDIERTSTVVDSSVDDSQSFTIENSYKTEKKQTKCNVNFWCTPGITSWSDANIQQYIDKIIAKKNVLCMMFCASPNSFANPEQIKYILAECVKAGIFSALVVTNMYVGPASDELLSMFKDMLAIYSDVTEINDDIIYYGHVGLCTKVNSTVFVAQDDEEYPMTGVDELILGISKSLTMEKAVGWGLTIVENGPFWLRKHAKIFNLLDDLKSLVNSAS